MSELILKGTELFMEKTGSADKLHISGNTERMLFREYETFSVK